MTHRVMLLILALSLAVGMALAAGDMTLAPPWEQTSAQKLTTSGSALLADGHAMPIMMDFTWSAPEGEPMVKYQSQFLGNAHYRCVAIPWDGWDWKELDELYSWGAAHKLYIVCGLNVAFNASYISRDATAAAQHADGSPAPNGMMAFMHPGYRAALGKALTALGEHLRDKPYQFGYYPQDEYAYAGLVGYEPVGLAAFRQWLVKKRGSLAQINQAWGSQFATLEAVQPPKQVETTVAFADWNAYRQWAQMDFTKFVYDTLHAADPNHAVIWSLPFYGGVECAASWWQFAPVSDVLMRHGISYSGGVSNLKLLSAISEWSGKPASALCMPPAYDPSFVQWSFMMDGPQSGLSHVCTAGTEGNAYYRGSADPAAGWKRREPMYTQSRALNDLVRQMGDTFLRSHPRPPQVGVLVSDAQTRLVGEDLNSLNGQLMMLGDLNLDCEIFAEPTWDHLKQYGAVLMGSCAHNATPQMADDLRQFVTNGGLLIMTAGAFEADDENRVMGKPGFGLEALIGSTEAATMRLDPKQPLSLIPADLSAFIPDANRRQEVSRLLASVKTLPVLGGASLRKPSGQTTVLAEVPGKGALITLAKAGKGLVLYFGNDPALPYQAGYTEDFAGVARKFDKDLLDTQAGFHFEPTKGAEQAVALQAHRSYAQLLRACLAGVGVRPRVGVLQHEDAIGAVKALSFRHGKDLWVGLANRIVLPGKDHEREPADRYHQVLSNVSFTLALDPGMQMRYAVKLPLGAKTATGFTALPELLRLQPGQRTGTIQAWLPRLTDCAAVLFTPGHDPIVGLEATPTTVVGGQDVAVHVRVANPSAQAARLALQVDGSPGLATGQKASLVCPAGKAADATLTARVNRTVEPGYQTLQVVATLPDGKRVFSPSAEIEVLPDVTLDLAGADRTLFPAEETPTRLTVRALNNRLEAASLTVDLQVGPGYRCEPAHTQLTLNSRESREVTLTVTGDDRSPALSTGNLAVSLKVGDVLKEERHTLRLARGVVAYAEARTLQPSNGIASRSTRDLSCLENRYLRVEWMGDCAILHSLIPRCTNRDVLLEGEYPIGLTWYALPGAWAQQSLTADDRQATMVLRGGPEGKMTLTATLGRDDRHLKVVYDCGDLGPRAEEFYLMSRPDYGQNDEVTIVPGKQGRAAYTGGRPVIPASDLAAPWVAVEAPRQKLVLGLAYDFPALDRLMLMPHDFANYVLLSPGKQPPGKITFWLTAQPGNADTVAQWCASLGLGK